MSGSGGGADQPPGFDQPPGATETEVFDAKGVCEQNKSQLESLKETMLRNKQSLKKKEEEVQEYARKLSKIKSRAKLSRRSRDASSSVEATPTSSPSVQRTSFADVVDDITQATTPKAKSSLLQKKLAENRKIFEQRSREMTENKRAVEEKVEAIRQQLDESDTTILELQKELTTVVPVQPVIITTTQVTSPGLQSYGVQDKDNRIAELSNKVLQLEATVLDLEENLKEKDSVIDSKTKAITLMSADLSKKSKSTLDTLEDTKDEMRTMQANFVLIETSLKHKIDNLLQQLQGRDGQIAEYEDTVEGLKEDLKKRKITDTATADFSRSTLDTLAETKDAMKSMQENFILIESSLKSKNDNLLEQLTEREVKLAESEERIFKLESGAGIVAPPEVRDLQSKLETVEQRNRQLQDEKYELQKSVAELQDKVISNEPIVSNGLIVEKDNRIAELENLIEELKKSNQLLLEESKTELQDQIVDLTSKNDEYSNKVNDLEKIVHDLETEKNELVKRIPEDSDESKEDAKVAKLSKELDELNKGMIKLKAQHKSKVKNLQKQLKSFEKVSDANAELVKLGNQVTLLEEEKGNLQLSLVDFDELKASAGDWQERIADLETKISSQSNEIDTQVQAIATLENQKLDLMQELHTVKQEVSVLEAENAESENLRVTAEMKVVELEEQLEVLHKSIVEPKQPDSANELEKDQYLDKIESLTQENNNLIIKLTKLEEKGTSEAGSTESFETFHETDRNELLKKIEILTQENNDLIIRLTKLEEKTGFTDSFETLNDSNKNELLKKIDLLAQENNNLILKLAKFEEKSSSDSGSTESFERIPEHGDNLSRLDVLTQENNELVIKLIKLEEKLALIEDMPSHERKSEATIDSELFNSENRIQILTQENNDLVIQVTKLQEKMGDQYSSKIVAEEDDRKDIEAEEKIKDLGDKIEDLKNNLEVIIKERDDLQGIVEQMTTNTFARELIEKLNELNKKNQTSAEGIREEITKLLRKLTDEEEEQGGVEDSAGYQGTVTVSLLENEIEDCKKFISEQKEMIDDMKSKLSEKQEELELQTKKITEYQAAGENLDKLQVELKDTLTVIEEWKLKCNELEERMKILESEKISIEEGLRILEAENVNLVKHLEEKDLETVELKKELNDTISQFEIKLYQEIRLVSTKEEEIAALKEIVANAEADLRDKYEKLQNEMITIDALQEDLDNHKLQFQEQRNTIESFTEEIGRLNSSVTSRDEEIIKLRKELENSRSLEEFNRLIATLNDNQGIMRQMEQKINEQTDESLAARSQIESITGSIHNMERELNKKQEEMNGFTEANRRLQEELNQAKTIEVSTSKEISDLQGTLDQNNVYLEDLRKELNGAYKKLELVKAQHVEDTEMQNRRLEDLIEDLNSKIHENESLKSEIEEKEKLVGKNVTEETKVALELRVTDLEDRLTESETKVKAQLDKMKKIAAHLKKKTTRCQDLEAKVSDLEEKWNSEKCEKETINKSIQENESIIREKDNKIVELEKRVQESDEQASMALENVGGLMQEIDASREKVNSLLEQVTEMGEEIEKLRSALEAKESELAEERTARQNLLSDYEKQQQNLEETTERARELRVRMEVMESEYVEQLSLIQKLKAENGMLSSKETQINERLENVEKESEERKQLLDKLEKGKADVIEKVEVHKAQTLDYELGENVTKTSQEQSQTSVEALEAKLQERDAVVESLEIELGKSIERINKLEEALVAVEERRHSLEKRTAILSVELEQSFKITEEASFSEDMLEQRLATLMAKDEAISEKLNETIDENNELTEKIKSLQDLNISLQERIDAVEEELKYGKDINEKLHNVDILYSELLQKHNLQESELKKTQQELHSAKQHIDSSEREVTSQINQLDFEKKQLLEKCEKLEDLNTNLIQEIDSLKDGVSLCRQRIWELETEVESHKEVNNQLITELNKHKESIPTSTEDTEQQVEQLKSILAEKELEIENYQRRNMQLQMGAFAAPITADIFDAPPAPAEIEQLRNVLCETKSQLEQLRQELLKTKSEHEKTLIEKEQYNWQVVTAYENLRTESNQNASEKDQQIDSLNTRINEIGVQLNSQSTRQGSSDEEITRLLGIVTSKEEEIQEIRKELDSAKEKLETVASSAKDNNILLDDMRLQQKEAEIIVNQIISVAEQKVNKFHENKNEQSSENTGLHRIALTFNELLSDFETLKLEKDELLRSQESYGNEINDLTKQLATYTQELDDVFTLKESLEKQVSDLTTTINQLRSEQESKQVEATIEKSVNLDVGCEWDTESTEKLEIEEEGWAWSAEEAQLEEQHQLSTAPLKPSVEIQLQARVAELEDQVKDLEAKKNTFDEESKAVQLKNIKLVKKLKEYKVQNDQLQQKLKLQQSSSFSDLDSAIEEELKSQIERLEKNLKDMVQEQKKAASEKEHLQKRLEVLTAANERFVEMKERQDMDVEVWQIRNKELTNKIQSLEWQLQEISSNVNPEEGFSMPSSQTESQIGLTLSESNQASSQISRVEDQSDQLIIKQYKDEIDDLKEEMEALASENEQLQHLLEEQKSKVGTERAEGVDEAEKLVEQNKNLQSNLNKVQEEYSLLRKQYEQSLMDANDQVTAMRQNNDLLRTEFDTKTLQFNNEKQLLVEEIEELRSKTQELEEILQKVRRENSDLTQNVETHKLTEGKLSSVSISLADVTELLNTRVQEVADLKQSFQQEYLERTEAENQLRYNIEQLSQELEIKRSEIASLRQSLSYNENEIANQQSIEIHGLRLEMVNKEQEIEKLRDELAVKESLAQKSNLELEQDSSCIEALQREVENLRSTALEKESNTEKINAELQVAATEIGRLKQEVEKKNLEVEKIQTELYEKQKRIDSFNPSPTLETQKQDVVALADSFPRFKMSSDDDFKVETDVEKLKSELREKEHEIKHLKYILSENTYPDLIQQLQDNISQLHNDKYQMEQSLKTKIESLNEELVSKQTEIQNLMQRMQVQQGDIVPIENLEQTTTDRPVLFDQESIARLQNELHTKEQELNELRYIIAQKDSQISLQDNSGQEFDDFEIEEKLQRLKGELYAKEQEVEHLRGTLAEKEKDIEELKQYKNLSEEDKNLIARLTSEKELIKEEAERLLQSRLAEKEFEIENLKQRLVEENKELVDSLELKETDIKNLRILMEQLNSERNENLHLKDEELFLVRTELSDKERQLAEVSITKDTEIHNLKIQIHEKEVRIEELAALTEEEERQLNDLRQVVESKEGEINNLKALLAETVQEYEIIQKALKRGTSAGPPNPASAQGDIEQTASAMTSTSDEGENLLPRSGVVSVEGELDLALYMLHQRDVRCEELTLELMQLLEERDTLQLRLSNAIRVNEELRRQKTVTSSPQKDSPSTSFDVEPLVEHPSPAKTDGPVEIAREALSVESSSLGEDKDVLAEKLSQLHTVHQRRDVTLCDERESRHTQQMAFVARRDMLSSLPPEAAARLVNANYTLSRDVQSQSSVLMNWLWGKSTPKVMHM